MTHASWNNERGEPSGPGHDNERLEYLGDAVLELVVGEYLFRRFPSYDEGQLTQLRAALVNTVSLARLGERLGLGETLLVGRGAAKTGARKLPSLLANAFEAMTGAIFLDQGYRVATRVFIQNIGDLADWTDENHKGRLQEVAQERTGLPPQYRVAAEGGSGVGRAYSAEAVVGGEVIGRGRGTTKQAAQQAAARAALDRLSRIPANAAARAAGAAREAARGAATESARVRRRVAEVAADRGASAGSRRDRRPARPPTPAPAQPPQPRRGLLATLRAAADAIVGLRRDEPPAEVTPAPARKRSRRGHRGGRGRGTKATPPPP
jgi:ribonuclease-3